MTAALTGFGTMVRLVLRLDRLRLAIWTVAIAGLVVVSAVSVRDTYPDQEAVRGYVELFGDNPALIAFAGPGYGFGAPNIGVVLVNETQLFAAVAMALMSIFLVNRHTRAEEDSERADLLRSGVVGRHAPTAAAMAVVGGANLAIGGLAAIGFVAAGYAAVGSLALAASLAAVALAFAGVTAVAAQVAGSSRGTLGWASAVLAAAFVLRAAGDIADNGLSWLSPIGWGQAIRAFAEERWWTLGLCLLVSLALLVLAFWLSTKRDLGSGLRPQHAGPASAPGWLTRPLGLALRLQRGALLGWLLALFVTGVVFGSLGEDVNRLFEENPALADVYATREGASLTDAYLSTSLTMLALIAGGFAVSSTLHLRGEEATGRAESVLAAPVGRWRWAASHLAVAVAGSALAVAAAGLGVGVAYAVVTGDPSQVPRLLGASLVTLPGVVFLIGVAALLFGIAPRAAPAAWIALAAMAVVGFFGGVLRLPDWARDLSPLEHLPGAPAEPVVAGPILAIAALAAALLAAGLWALRRRDLQLH